MHFKLLLLVSLHDWRVVTGSDVVRGLIVLLILPSIVGHASSSYDLLGRE